MADDCTIPRAALLALRDQLRERATRAHGWFMELTAERPEPLSEYEARERVAALVAQGARDGAIVGHT